MAKSLLQRKFVFEHMRALIWIITETQLDPLTIEEHASSLRKKLGHVIVEEA